MPIRGENGLLSVLKGSMQSKVNFLYALTQAGLLDRIGEVNLCLTPKRR
jgi:hypothetical protein